MNNNNKKHKQQQNGCNKTTDKTNSPSCTNTANGRIHVIDGLLLDWPVQPGQQQLQANGRSMQQQQQQQGPMDIMETLKQCDKFDGFVTLAEGTGLSSVLKQGKCEPVLSANSKCLLSRVLGARTCQRGNLHSAPISVFRLPLTVSREAPPRRPTRPAGLAATAAHFLLASLAVLPPAFGHSAGQLRAHSADFQSS